MANLDLLSYERDSRWKPHLSWTYPDWTLQQRMESQAAQREQAWQRIADKLGPYLAHAGNFGQSDYIGRDLDELDQERAYEKAPLLAACGAGAYKVGATNLSTSTRTSGHESQLQSQYDQHQHDLHDHHHHQHNNNNNNHHHHHHHHHHQQQQPNLRYADSLGGKTHSPPVSSMSPSPLSSHTTAGASSRHPTAARHYYNYNACTQAHQLAHQQPHCTTQYPPAHLLPITYTGHAKTRLAGRAGSRLGQSRAANYGQPHYLGASDEHLRHQASMKRAKRRCWTVSAILVLLMLLLFTIVALMGLGVIQYKKFPRVPV